MRLFSGFDLPGFSDWRVVTQPYNPQSLEGLSSHPAGLAMTTHTSPGFDWTFYFFWLVGSTLGWLVGSYFFAAAGFLASGVALGVLQWLALERRLPRARAWILATAAGWIACFYLLLAINPWQSAFLTGLIVGLCSGFAQWLVLRQRIELAGWWPVISVVAWTSGFALLPGIFNTGLVAGAVSGVALELLLRNPKDAAVIDGRKIR
jgi:hypothetical protein